MAGPRLSPCTSSQICPSRSDVSSPDLRSSCTLRSKRIEGDLAHDRVDHVLDLLRQQRLPLLGVRGRVEQRLEGQHLAEHGGRLGQRQRRRRQQRPLRRRQHLVHAVAQLVRQRHHVARLALVVHEDVGVRRRHRRMREGAGRLALAHRRIDPAAVEEALGDGGHVRREAAVGVEHHRLRVRPGHDALRLVGQRRVAVPVGELVLAEPPGLHGVVAMRGAADRPRARRRPARRPPRARPGWRDAGCRPRP